MLTFLTLLVFLTKVNSDCFDKKFPLSFGSEDGNDDILKGFAFLEDGTTYTCGLTEDDGWTDSEIGNNLFVPFVVKVSPQGYIQWGRYIRNSDEDDVQTASEFMNCQVTDDEQYLVLVYETERMPHVVTLRTGTGDLYLTQKVKNMYPLRAKPQIAAYDIDQIFVTLDASYQNVDTVAVYQFESRNNYLRIGESRYFDQATSATAISTYRRQYAYVALKQTDTINGGGELNAVIV